MTKQAAFHFNSPVLAFALLAARAVNPQGVRRISAGVPLTHWKAMTMADMKDKMKDKIDQGASKAKDATNKAVDKTKEGARKAGESIKDAGKNIKDKGK